MTNAITLEYNRSMTIQDKIGKILREAGWSQEELARRLKVSFKTLNSWATGKTEPRENNVEAIEDLYLDIVGRSKIDPELLAKTEAKALALHIDLREILENPELLKTTTLFLTYHTNTIEGSTMTIEDVEEVLENEDAVIPDKTVREQIEARNHRAAFLYLLTELKKQGKSFQWTTDLIKSVHLRLMNSLMESAGQYRRYGVRIMGSQTPLANFLSVPRKMEKLVTEMNMPCQNALERLAVTHANFEQIHPFGDGNGRTGRLIMFAQALQNGIVPPLVIKERKRAYYKYLQLAQTREEYEFLRLFIAESILFTNNLLSSGLSLW